MLCWSCCLKWVVVLKRELRVESFFNVAVMSMRGDTNGPRLSQRAGRGEGGAVNWLNVNPSQTERSVNQRIVVVRKKVSGLEEEG